MADYSKMSDDEYIAGVFYVVDEIVKKGGGEHLLSIPGVYELVAEYYHNDVLDFWASENQDLAYPEDEQS